MKTVHRKLKKKERDLKIAKSMRASKDMFISSPLMMQISGGREITKEYFMGIFKRVFRR